MLYEMKREYDLNMSLIRASIEKSSQSSQLIFIILEEEVEFVC